MAKRTKLINGKEVELTKEETRALEREEAAREARLNKTRYINKRRQEYPSISDQLDAIIKQLNYMRLRGQLDLIEELDDIVSRCMVVKRDNPKPKRKR